MPRWHRMMNTDGASYVWAKGPIWPHAQLAATSPWRLGREERLDLKQLCGKRPCLISEQCPNLEKRLRALSLSSVLDLLSGTVDWEIHHTAISPWATSKKIEEKGEIDSPHPGANSVLGVASVLMLIIMVSTIPKALNLKYLSMEPQSHYFRNGVSLK